MGEFSSGNSREKGARSSIAFHYEPGAIRKELDPAHSVTGVDRARSAPLIADAPFHLSGIL
jgi:hypothetical protein